jgi:hypothetical protein
MAYTSVGLAARDLAFTKAGAATDKVRKPSFFNWLFTAMMAARTRAAEREIARYLQGAGGKFTDEAEREIERRFLSNQSRW